MFRILFIYLLRVGEEDLLGCVDFFYLTWVFGLPCVYFDYFYES
jgi:hypothetical protein